MGNLRLFRFSRVEILSEDCQATIFLTELFGLESYVLLSQHILQEKETTGDDGGGEAIWLVGTGAEDGGTGDG